MIARLPSALLLALALQEVIGAGVVRLHYWPEQRRLAASVAERIRLQTALPGLPPEVLGREPVHVYLAPDPARWDSLTGGAAPEWGAGIADTERGLIVIPTFDWERTPPHTLSTTLRHELAHVALQRFIGQARTPRWFTEGYAQVAAGEWTWDSAWRLRMAFLGGRAPPLDSLTLEWPVAEGEARLAYLLSASALSYLIEQSGEHGLRVFLERWRQSLDFEQAFRATFGLTTGQFEEDWRKHVRQAYGWPLLLGHSMIFWLVAALVLIVLFAVRRRRDRARLARLRATELPDDPAFWEPYREPPPRDRQDPTPGG